MGPIAALIHLINLLAPALGLGVLAAALTKLLWWRQLTGVSWLRLARAAVFASTLALLAALVLLGRDGKMLSYAAMVAACAAGLGWAGRRV